MQSSGATLRDVRTYHHAVRADTPAVGQAVPVGRPVVGLLEEIDSSENDDISPSTEEGSSGRGIKASLRRLGILSVSMPEEGKISMAENDHELDPRRPDIAIGSLYWYTLTPNEIDSILEARVASYEAAIAARGGRRPKREGYVVERIAMMDNLRIADAHAQDGKVQKNRYIRRHNRHAEKDLRRLQLMILTEDYPPSNYKSDEIITDYGKVRVIVKRNYYPWRILEHAIMEIVMGIILRMLITDSVACIKGKGLHFGVKRMRKMLRLNPDLKWFWKCDYKKYYQSIPHDVIESSLRKRIKDEKFFEMIRLALFSYDSGAEIILILDEEEQKKRNANWLIHEPAAGSACRLRS